MRAHLKAAVWIMFGVLLLGTQMPVGASDSPPNRESLRGLKGVAVLIEDIDPHIAAEGLTRDTIQNDVELRLREAGISILTGPTDPYLYVRVSVQERVDIWFYVIEVSLKQAVTLYRNPEISLDGSTWSVMGYGSVGKDMGVNEVRDNVKDEADRFANAYLSVNPK
ncbi:MAG TPA: hypothetical protein VMD77_00320 [Candidatus Baltobacteraceae bacterium]|nr:hypothetical protein [Candidatus Baltobacteraceae bacterium]